MGVQSLLKPKSIAIVGASEKIGPGFNAFKALEFVGYEGEIYLVNPKSPELFGRRTYASLDQSGSVGIALLNSARGIGFSYLITTGNEAVTAASDYLNAVIDDANVTTILVFAEQIKKPAEFMRAVRRAGEANKPVVVLKSGRSQSGKAAVLAHTGAIAGSDEACDAALLAAGAMQVHSLDDLIETALLASKSPTRPTKPLLGGLSLSGGEIALVLDAAEEIGVEFAPLDSALPTVKELLPPFAYLANPLDLTWAGLYDPAVAQGCAEAIACQTNVGMLVLLQDAPTGLGSQQATRYSKLLEAVGRGAASAKIPVVALSNVSDQPHPALQDVADKAKIPYLRGTRVGLSAISRYVTWSTRPAQSLVTGSAKEGGLAKSRLDVIPSHRLAAEHEARDILRSYGVAGPQEQFSSSVEGAVAAAAEIGFPVVLKGLVE